LVEKFTGREHWRSEIGARTLGLLAPNVCRKITVVNADLPRDASAINKRLDDCIDTLTRFSADPSIIQNDGRIDEAIFEYLVQSVALVK